MPIKIPNDLPARETLENENIFIMTEYRALHQDIRPLKIAILNLMPTKIATETQLLRCLANTPLQIEIDLIQTSTYDSKNTSQSHLESFYKTFENIKDNTYDGMIITGAPVENMDFENVDYWGELCEIMEWTKTHVHSTYHICWAAQAGLYYHYGINKRPLNKKKFGVFCHTVTNPKVRLFRGFDSEFFAPHSRHTEIRTEDVEANDKLRVLSTSAEAGLFAVGDKEGHQFFIMGHSEYDPETLANEYFRDKNAGLEIEVPVNYFRNDDPTLSPVNRWRAHGQLMFTNWLNYYVYQTTPFDITSIRK
ncbi:MAG: homoserine O-succinyltransferase [Lachnospiraceae bacterium]|nr:homoserine O-succinyltransferase [Lachnospiraceae bacterium]